MLINLKFGQPSRSRLSQKPKTEERKVRTMDGSCWAESLLTSHYCCLFLILLSPFLSSYPLFMHDFCLMLYEYTRYKLLVVKWNIFPFPLRVILLLFDCWLVGNFHVFCRIDDSLFIASFSIVSQRPNILLFLLQVDGSILLLPHPTFQLSAPRELELNSE